MGPPTTKPETPNSSAVPDMLVKATAMSLRARDKSCGILSGSVFGSCGSAYLQLHKLHEGGRLRVGGGDAREDACSGGGGGGVEAHWDVDRGCAQKRTY